MLKTLLTKMCIKPREKPTPPRVSREFLERAIVQTANKLPSFDPTWDVETQRLWYEQHRRLIELLDKKPKRKESKGGE